MRLIEKVFSWLKLHILPLLILIGISFFFLFGIFNKSILPMLDQTTFYLPRIEILKQSFDIGSYFPLWNPYIMSGTPLYAQPGFVGPDSITATLVLLLSDPVLAIKMIYWFDIVFAGIFMYLLGFFIFKDRRTASILGCLYMLNGFAMKYYAYGALSTMNQYPFLPLVMLFVIKSFKSLDLKNKIINSIITGILLSVQLRAGPDMKIILWSSIMFIIYFTSQIVSNDFKKKIKDAILIGLIISVIFVGLSAQRVLVEKEYLDSSSRGENSYEQSANRPVKFNDMFSRLIEPIGKDNSESIGIIACLMLLFGFYKGYKNRFVLFLSTTIIIGLLATAGTFVYRIVWTLIPLFHSMRYLERGLILFVFPAILLAGYGLKYFFQYIEQKGVDNKKRTFIFLALFVLVVADLTVFGPTPIDKTSLGNVNDIITKNEILSYISQDKSIFRIHVYEIQGIDWNTEFYNIPLGLQSIYGYETAWYPPYFNEYLGLAYKSPFKMWGLLNVKYITSTKELNFSELKFVKKFNECIVCPPFKEFYKAHGPYLYENNLFMPRAYFVNNAILIVGEDDSAKQTMYGLMLDNRFNPKSSVIIKGKSNIDDYTIEDLEKYNSIVLVKGSFSQNSIYKLKEYVSSGGKIYPNIIEGKNSISHEDIDDVLGGSSVQFVPIEDKDYITHNFDKYELRLGKNIDGWLVLSEKFSMFEGWTAKSNKDNLQIERADGVISAVYINDKTESIIFEYRPKSYIIGTWITIITAIFIIVYFSYIIIRKLKIKKEVQL